MLTPPWLAHAFALAPLKALRLSFRIRADFLGALQRRTENMGTPVTVRGSVSSSSLTSESGCRGLETVQVLDAGEIRDVDVRTCTSVKANSLSTRGLLTRIALRI